MHVYRAVRQAAERAMKDPTNIMLGEIARESAAKEKADVTYDRGAAAGDDYTDVPRHAGSVRRYHTWAVHHQETVGEHCWQVYLLYCQLWGRPSSDVTHYVMHHDTAELVVGDPPFPVKSRDPLLKAAYDSLEALALIRLHVDLPVLTDAERARVKVCDLLQMMTHGMREREMGNLLAGPIVLRTELAALAVARERLSFNDLVSVESFAHAEWTRHERILRTYDVGHGYSARYRHGGGGEVLYYDAGGEGHRVPLEKQKESST